MTTETHTELIGRTFPLHRPGTLAACARIGARRYRRRRDLPGAVPGLLAAGAGAILPRLVVEEQRCEAARLDGSAAYRPGQHVQILSALLAEAAACQTGPPRPRARPAGQAKASGSEALRLAT